MKFLIVIVGLFAIGNASIIYRVGPIDPFVAPGLISSAEPAIIPNTVPEAELADWESYKVTLSSLSTLQTNFTSLLIH